MNNINIFFYDGDFVEIEDDDGNSIRIGEWVKAGKYWKLKIPDLRDTVEQPKNHKDELEHCRQEFKSIQAQLYEAHIALGVIAEEYDTVLREGAAPDKVLDIIATARAVLNKEGLK